MEKRIRVLPATVRVENIDLLDFLKDVPKIFKSVPELGEVRASSLNLATTKGTVSFGYVKKDAFNMSGPSPEILDKLVEAIKKHYEPGPKPAE